MMRINSNYQARNGDREESDLEHLRKLFIGGLAPITTEESLKSFYEQWGEVTDSVVMKDPATKRSRGFGFITYASPVMVDKAQNARPHIIDGKTVDAKRALPRPELNNPEANAMVKKVFVGGLKENHDEPTLHEYFSQFGNVVGVKILTDRLTGRKRGFAFVEFDDYDAVDKAVLQKHHSIKYVLVDVKKSAYKQEVQRKHNLLAQQQQVQGQGMPQHPQQSYQQMMPQVPQQAGYNGWGYGQPAYQQPPPHQQAQVPNYNYAPQNGTPAAAWNAAPPAAYQTSWNQNGYGAPPSGIPPPAAATAVGPPPATNWNGTQNFGDYQQAYNGGPTKAGNLTGNRMNPYNVPATANYGNVTPVSYNYSTTPQGYVGMYGGSPNNVSIPTNTQQSLKVLQTKTTVRPANNHRY